MASAKRQNTKESPHTAAASDATATSTKVHYDEKDMTIMKKLMMDARLSARQISLAMGVSTVTVINRVKNLEKTKAIKGYAAAIDHEKVGYGLTAIIEVVAKKNKIVDIENNISKYNNVCAVYDITGDTDAIIIAKFKSRAELSKFVKNLGSIQYIESTTTHIVLDTLKEDFRLI